jgi:hypothetical protein
MKNLIKIISLITYIIHPGAISIFQQYFNKHNKFLKNTNNNLHVLGGEVAFNPS